jgi:hypothetical protein
MGRVELLLTNICIVTPQFAAQQTSPIYPTLNCMESWLWKPCGRSVCSGQWCCGTSLFVFLLHRPPHARPPGIKSQSMDHHALRPLGWMRRMLPKVGGFGGGIHSYLSAQLDPNTVVPSSLPTTMTRPRSRPTDVETLHVPAPPQPNNQLVFNGWLLCVGDVLYH